MWILALILFASTCFAQKEEFDLEFKEDGKRYKEKIIFDRKENTTEYDVPKHGNLEKTTFFIDHKMGVQAMKMEDQQKCYLRDVSATQENINDTKTALNQVGGKFPENKYLVENHQLVPVARINPMDVSPKIRQFCGNFPIFKVEETSLEEMEKRAKRLISGNSKRSSFNFVLCNRVQSYYVIKCSKTQTSIAKCKFSTRNCLYKMTCKAIGKKGYFCNGTPLHVYNNLVCCDFYCV